MQSITHPQLVRVAVPRPLRRLYDYRMPAGQAPPPPGCRVRVPFANRSLTAWVVSHPQHSELDAARLLEVASCIDHEPLFPAALWALLQWCWSYYHHPPGEVLVGALPGQLRGARELPSAPSPGYRLTEDAPEPESLGQRAPRQRDMLEFLSGGARSLADFQQLDSGWQAVLRRLESHGWVQACTEPELRLPGEPAPKLTDQQAAAVEAMRPAVAGKTAEFERFLLDGVTGSGKTEVYLALIAEAMAAGRQSLVLVPEIGLTPQLVARFRRRLGVEPLLYHSGLSEGERLDAWLRARAGQAPVVIGTRSAVFMPLAEPGLVILDEEHDLSFKQQDRFRYSARDVAVQRARLEDCPVVLGSATPSLESLANAQAGRYRHLRMDQRATAARLPDWRVLDLCQQPLEEGLCPAAIEAIERTTKDGGQVLVFLNRRGYAPVLMCHQCGWQGDCPRCDAHLTYHRGPGSLRCHRCDYQRPAPRHCPECGALELQPVGEGTERLSQYLRQRFPDLPVFQVDRDTTQRKHALAEMLEQIRSAGPAILVGTQMLAKGHHFPRLALALVVSIDPSLFSVDFRATERLAQLLTQVAGRSGRDKRRGEVLLQTHQPGHPLLLRLPQEGYAVVANDLLAERRATGLPPVSFHATLRAEAGDLLRLQAFLDRACGLARDIGLADGLQLFGPMPALQARRAGRFRMQVMIQSDRRDVLQGFLGQWLAAMDGQRGASGVRRIIDVDPQEF